MSKHAAAEPPNTAALQDAAAAAPVEEQPIESQVIESSPTHRRIVGLDGIRGLGCLAVVVGHVGEVYTPHTHHKALLDILGLALILFFVLSGFLLFLPYVRKLTKPNAVMPDTRQYFLHRVFRVFPGYLVIFLICNFALRAVFVENPTIQRPGTQHGTGMITDPAELLANLTLTQTYIPKFVQTGINPSWSLTLEIAFYLSLPLLGLLMFALRRRFDVHPLKLALLGPGILLAVGLAGRALIPLVYANVDVHNYQPDGDYHVPDLWLQNWGPNLAAVFSRCLLSNADLFAYGMLAAVLFVAIEQEVIGEKAGKWIHRASIVGIPVFGVVTLKLLKNQSAFGFAAIGVVSGLFLVMVVLPLAWGGDPRLARWFDARPFYFVGLISMSVYLWHYPLLLLLGRYHLVAGDSWGGMFRNMAIVTVATLVLATITYYCVEKPGLNQVKRFRKR
ncbi:MAG: acyltransferase [Mycobacterium sp.]